VLLGRAVSKRQCRKCAETAYKDLRARRFQAFAFFNPMKSAETT
jgi:hypothetical protein